MKLSTSLFIAAVAALAPYVLATDSTSTLTVHPGCPTASPADQIVTRSAVAVPSCGAGNATKPTLVGVSGGAVMTMTGGGSVATQSMSGGPAAQFTGGAAAGGKSVLGALGVGVLGGVVALVV